MTFIKNKLLGWWMCLISRFRKLSTGKQFVLYSLIFILPIFLMFTFSVPLNPWVFAYYLCAYLFFQVGFTMVKK